MTSKLKFVNASTQNAEKPHVGCHDLATLTKKMFQECPEKKHCDSDFLDDSFLSSKIDDSLDELFKVDDLETSDDDDESQDEDEKKNFFVMHVYSILGNAFTAVDILLEMQKICSY